MVMPTNCLGWIAGGPWQFGDFCNIFLLNIGKDQKNLNILAQGPLLFCAVL